LPTHDSFKRLLALLTKSKLVELCKSMGIKGYSKLKKSEIIETISSQASDEDLPALFQKIGMEELHEVIENATNFINGKSVGVEHYSDASVGGDTITVDYTMMRDPEVLTGKISSMGAPLFDYSCTCSVAQEGGLCMHYWTAILFLISKRLFQPDQLGDFTDLASPELDKASNRIKSSIKPEPEPVDTSGISYVELLQSMTVGNRYAQARLELGLEASVPAKKGRRAKVSGETGGQKAPAKRSRRAKSPEESGEKRVESLTRVDLVTNQQGPPAKFYANFIKIDESGSHESSLHVFIDEETIMIAHDNCMDFQMRMAREKYFCKHIIQVFHSIDENTGRRLISNIQKFKFITEIPKSVVAARSTIQEEVMNATPATLLEDSNAIKDSIMTYLLDHESDADARSERALLETFGDGALQVLGILVGEGMVQRSAKGAYMAK